MIKLQASRPRGECLIMLAISQKSIKHGRRRVGRLDSDNSSPLPRERNPPIATLSLEMSSNENCRFCPVPVFPPRQNNVYTLGRNIRQSFLGTWGGFAADASLKTRRIGELCLYEAVEGGRFQIAPRTVACRQPVGDWYNRYGRTGNGMEHDAGLRKLLRPPWGPLNVGWTPPLVTGWMLARFTLL